MDERLLRTRRVFLKSGILIGGASLAGVSGMLRSRKGKGRGRSLAFGGSHARALRPQTRLAAVPMIIDMLVAIVSTKIPILLGHGFWGFSLPKLNAYGFWPMVHEARAGWSMLLTSLFLLIVGAGPWSLDAKIYRQALQTAVR